MHVVSAQGSVPNPNTPNDPANKYTPRTSPQEHVVYKSLLQVHNDVATPNILLRAVRDGETEIVSKLLAHSKDAKKTLDSVEDGYQNSCVHYAAFYGHTTILQNLLILRANPNAQNHVANTPLHLACENGQLECVKVLIMCGSNCFSQNMMGHTPLYVATHLNKSDITTFLSQVQPQAQNNVQTLSKVEAQAQTNESKTDK